MAQATETIGSIVANQNQRKLYVGMLSRNAAPNGPPDCVWFLARCYLLAQPGSHRTWSSAKRLAYCRAASRYLARALGSCVALRIDQPARRQSLFVGISAGADDHSVELDGPTDRPIAGHDPERSRFTNAAAAEAGPLQLTSSGSNLQCVLPLRSAEILVLRK